MAIVLVSDRFLVSHAYLKDSTVGIGACCLMNQASSLPSDNRQDTSNSLERSVQSALSQAKLVVKDLQAVEARYSSDSGIHQVLGGLDWTQSQERVSPSSNILGSIGLLELCGFGITHHLCLFVASLD